MNRLPESIRSLIRHYQVQSEVIWLDSYGSTHPEAKISYLATHPKRRIVGRGNSLSFYEGNTLQVLKGEPWKLLHQVLNEHSGWWFGYLGYEMNEVAQLKGFSSNENNELPLFYFMQPDTLIQVDKNAELSWIIGAPPAKLDNVPEQSFSLTELESNISLEQYKACIASIQRDIKEGSYYEMNYCRALHARFEGDAFALYERMRAQGAVPFGAYVSLTYGQLCAISPERFLKIQDGLVISDPIKGTAAQKNDADEDLRTKQQLASSEKNRAENLMIVDLVRNDLSTISEAGSVKVEKLFEIQSFGTVHQMVSRISATLRSGVSVLEAVQRCFPMGSMTGAPKRAAMEAIQHYEPEARGVYSGALGYITPDGNADFNVLIRTAIISQGQLKYGIGGAITSDSDAQEEWDETEIKARVLTNVL